MQESEAKATILVVDDSTTIRTIVSSIVRKSGHTTIMAEDGNSCIEIINSHQIDLLLLDVHMPGKTGLEVLSYLRDHHLNIPVIMISGSADIEEAVKALKMGAYDFLLKPVNPDKLTVTVKNALAESELRKNLKLFQQEKLASIGQLAAGIAHEINNPLNFIKINFVTQQGNIADILSILNEYRAFTKQIDTNTVYSSELQKLHSIEQDLDLDTLLVEIPQIFTESQGGFERITTIINSMRNFSYKHAIDEKVLFDMNKGIRDTLIISRNEYRYCADIETDLKELPPVPCNPEQMNQVFLNLIINGAHAIASQKRATNGKIRIATWIDSTAVYCSIADDGPGIPLEVQKHIFEPFFTTKKPGIGTGLGLSISYDIIAHKHHGTLTVDCPHEGGTVFTITIPLRINKEQ